MFRAYLNMWLSLHSEDGIRMEQGCSCLEAGSACRLQQAQAVLPVGSFPYHSCLALATQARTRESKNSSSHDPLPPLPLRPCAGQSLRHTISAVLHHTSVDGSCFDSKSRNNHMALDVCPAFRQADMAAA